MPLSFFRQGENYILDGAMGTELQRRGYPARLPLWTALANLECPRLVQRIHLDYIRAGADIITTNTFRTTRYTCDKINQPVSAEKLTFAAVSIARDAIMVSGRSILLAGSITTLEDCYRPDLVPSMPVLQAAHGEQVALLKAAGVDFILAETIQTIREAEAIASACRNEEMPFILSFVTNGMGALLGGESLQMTADRVAPYHPMAIALNCRPVGTITSDLMTLQAHYDGLTCCYANGPGEPEEVTGWKLDKNQPIAAYMHAAKQWLQLGVCIIGGCCGTTPDFIRKLYALMRSDNDENPFLHE